MDVKDLTAEQMEGALAFIKDEARKINKSHGTEPRDGDSPWDFLNAKDAFEMLEERATKKLKALQNG